MNAATLGSGAAIVRNLAIFSLVAVGACLAIHGRLPLPDAPEVGSKLKYLALHADDYDTLFIGSSHIYRQISPAIFDQAAAEKGMASKSFNAGVDGMQPPEDGYFLDQILAFHPQRLRRVLIEVNQIRVPINPAKRGTDRAAYWHDWVRLKQLFHEAADVKESKHLRGNIKALWEPMGYFSEHLSLFLQNMSNFGRGSTRLVHSLQGDGTGFRAADLGPAFDGYLGIEGNTMNSADQADYAVEIAKRSQAAPRIDSGSATTRAAIRRMMHQVEALHATPILIVPPSIPSQDFRPPAEGGETPVIFDFTKVDAYPALYDEGARLNASHLNATGAAAFSRALAERLAEWEKAKR